MQRDARRLILFVVLSVVLLALYEFCLIEIAAFFAQFLQTHAQWLVFHTLVPFALLMSFAAFMGLFGGHASFGSMIFAMLWSGAMAPMTILMQIFFTCTLRPICA